MTGSPQHATGSTGPYHSCNCIGPQDGKPLCPCMMRSVSVENGRYVQKTDHGPVKASEVNSQQFNDMQRLFARQFGEW